MNFHDTQMERKRKQEETIEQWNCWVEALGFEVLLDGLKSCLGLLLKD
jgi:hypothetical protein